jgi:hypothetical protein
MARSAAFALAATCHPLRLCRERQVRCSWRIDHGGPSNGRKCRKRQSTPLNKTASARTSSQTTSARLRQLLQCKQLADCLPAPNQTSITTIKQDLRHEQPAVVVR